MKATYWNTIKLFFHCIFRNHEDGFRYGSGDAGFQKKEWLVCRTCGYGHLLDNRGVCTECGMWADARNDLHCPLASNLWEAQPKPIKVKEDK